MTSPVSAAAIQAASATAPRLDDSNKAAKDFEQLLLFELLKTMRKTVPTDDDGGSMFARGTFDAMFDRAIAQATAGSLGVAPMLEAQLRPDAVTPAPSEATSALNPGAALSSALTNPMDAASMAVPGPGQMPVAGRESSPYGWRTHPVSGERKFHGGLDLAAPTGTEIRSVQRGKVVFAGRQRGYGKTVEIRHPDGVVTRYAHASRLHVSEGQSVDAGEAIADVGSTGQSTGPHLHFEARRGGHTIDPSRYLDQLKEQPRTSGGRPRAGVTWSPGTVLETTP